MTSPLAVRTIVTEPLDGQPATHRPYIDIVLNGFAFVFDVTHTKRLKAPVPVEDKSANYRWKCRHRCCKVIGNGPKHLRQS
jgi:hypothetical protein